jgi:hypothetical protein
MKQRRRILRKLRLTEISGVDRPCVEGATVTILKRRGDDDPEHEENDMAKLHELERTVDGLEKQIAELSKQVADHAAPEKSAYSADFDALVSQEIARGYPPNAAAQMVLAKHGPRPDAATLRKSLASESALTDFMAEVDRTMIEKRIPRSAAMSEVRKRDPAAFQKYQEV